MKKLLYILVSLIVLLVIAVGVLVTVIDPNQFKPLIAEQVEKNTGRQLDIQGDIGWRFWPSIGFSVENVALKNPEGFAEENLVKLDSAELSVSVMPLLSDRLEVGMVSLHGARVFVQTLASGKSNLDGLGDSDPAKSSDSPQATQEPTVAGEPQPASSAKWQIDIQGVELVDASALIRDDQSGTRSEISSLNFTMGEVAKDIWVPVEFDIEGKQNDLAFTLRGNSDVKLNRDWVKSEAADVSVSATVVSPDLNIESATVTATGFKFGDSNQISANVKGSTADITFDASTETQLNVNQDLTLVVAEGLDALVKLAGDSLPNKELTLSTAGNLTYKLDAQTVALEQLALGIDDIKLNGVVRANLSGDIPAVRFDLKGNAIDVDKYTASASNASSGESKPAAGGTSSDTPASSGGLSKQEPDLTALKGLDIAGKLALDSFKVANVSQTGLILDFAVNRGLVTINKYASNLYKGRVEASGKLDARKSPASYQVNKSVTGVDVLPLLKDAAELEILAGTGNITANVSGTGLSELAMRQKLTGKVGINFADGALYGVNLPEMIREAKATLKGEKASYVEEVRKTDFSAVTADFNLGQGKATTSNLKMEAPALRVRSEGSTDLLQETLDFDVFTSVVGTSKGQGGKDIDELKDVTIPVHIAGTWQEPSYQLDVKKLLTSNKVLEEKARKEAERGLKKLLGDKAEDDKVKDAADKLLKGLFN